MARRRGRAAAVVGRIFRFDFFDLQLVASEEFGALLQQFCLGDALLLFQIASDFV